MCDEPFIRKCTIDHEVDGAGKKITKMWVYTRLNVQDSPGIRVPRIEIKLMCMVVPREILYNGAGFCN